MKLLVSGNPFQPSVDREEYALVKGDPLSAALDRHMLGLERYVISCNGELLPPSKALDLVPSDDDCIVAVPRLENPTLKSIAMIGVMAAAALVSPGVVITLFGTSFAIGGAIAAGVVAVGGSLLVNAVSSLFTKKDIANSYTWDGPQTVARSGIPIPKGNGTFRSGGNVVESWVDMQNADYDVHDTDDGADKIGRQWINLRVDFGFGPATAIRDIRINDKDIANYADVAYVVRLGTNDQTAVTASDPGWQVLNQTTTGDTINTTPTTDFNRINNNYPVTQRVRCGIARNYVIVPGRRNDTQRLEVVVQFPDGVWRYDDGMVIKRAAIAYNVYYKRHSENAWTLAQSHTYINIRQTILRQRTVIDGLSPDVYDVKVEKIGSGAAYNPLDYFEHESNKWGDELWIESVQETSYTALAYPNMIQICLRIMATDQLAGSGVQVTAEIDYGIRSEVPEELAEFAPDNPAVVAYDVFADPIVGAGTPERVDVPAFSEWAALCDTQVDDGNGGTQKLATFNGIFEKDGNTIWDSFQSICVMSRAWPQQIGTKVTVALDKEDDPVQMFHVGNIYADSYSKEYLNLDDRAQEIEVDFADAEDDYKTRTPLRVITPEDMASTEVLKKARISLLGCTNKVQAYYWAMHKLLDNKIGKLRTHTWDSPVQAIVCRIGNVALLQHDVPQWADGGNVVSATATQVQLDQSDLAWDAEGTYTLTVKHDVLLRGGGTVVLVTGSTYLIDGYDGTSPVKRVAGQTLSGPDMINDAPIIGYGWSGTHGYIKLADGYSLELHQVVNLYDLDVLETRTVTALDLDLATVDSPFTNAPAENSGYIYQSSTKQAIKVRISGMKRNGDQKFTLTAVDYNPAIYDIPAPLPDLLASSSTPASFTLYRPTVATPSGYGSISDADAPLTGGTATLSAYVVAGVAQTESCVWDGFSSYVTTTAARLYVDIGTYSNNGGTAGVVIAWPGHSTTVSDEQTSRTVGVDIPIGTDLSGISITGDVDSFLASGDSPDGSATLYIGDINVKVFN